MFWRLIAVLFWIFICVGSGQAATSPGSGTCLDVCTRPPLVASDSLPTAPPPGFSRVQISLWYGHSALPGALLGAIPNGRLQLLGFRLRRRLLPTTSQLSNGYAAPTLSYTADLVPFASVQIPQEALPATFYADGPPRRPLSAQGLGLYPIGLRVAFRPTTRLRPFLAGHAGGLYFFESVPDERGKQLNFAVGIGGGIELSIAPQTLLTAAYRYHHLSNGFRGSINPGLDANVLYLGIGVAL